MRQRKSIVTVCAFLVIVSYLPFLTGCSSIAPGTAVGPGEHVKAALGRKTGTGALNQAQLQAVVMNFEDLYVMSVWQAYDDIKRSTVNPEVRATAQWLKVRANTNALAIAAGRNTAVSLLDMVVFVSLSRYTIENYWVPKVFGPSGSGLVQTYHKLEQEIWKIAARVLTEDQQKTLRGLINEWIAANPAHYYVAGIRLSDFAEVQGMSPTSQMEAGTLLADVEKAVAVAQEGLLVSERVMFYVERLPRLMTMQTELILDQVAAAPDAEQLRTNLNKFTAAAERLSLVAADLPKYVSEERKAAVDDVFSHFSAERQRVMDDLTSQESRLRAVFEEVRAILDRATPLTDKLNTTVRSADGLYRLFDATPSKLPAYNELLEKSIVVMDKLAGILAEVTPLYETISRGGANVVDDPVFGKFVGLADHLFWRAMLLIAFFLVGLLAMLLIYKHLSLRIGGGRRPK